MGASAYASLSSLMTVIKRSKLNLHTQWRRRIESLEELVRFLIEFLEKNSQRRSKETEVLDTMITNAAYEAEDTIESYMIKDVLFRRDGVISFSPPVTSLFRDLDRLIQEMDLIIQQTSGINITQETKSEKDQHLNCSVPHNTKGQKLDNNLRGMGRLISFRDQRANNAESSQASYHHHHHLQNEHINILDDPWTLKLAPGGRAEDIVQLSDRFLYPDLVKRIEEIELNLLQAKEVTQERKSEKDQHGHSANRQKVANNLQEMVTFLSMSNRKANDAESSQASYQHHMQNVHIDILDDPSAPKLTPTICVRHLNEMDDNNTLCQCSFSPCKATDTMVGFDNQLRCLMDKLRLRRQHKLEIIPVVGMGGIGKSTLARNVYAHPHIVRHFDVRAWVTVSQKYTIRTLIRPLLRDIGVRDVSNIDDGQLGDHLYKGLCRRRYLIIVDDIWSREAWDEIRRFLPDNDKGSRIVFTTRLWSVAHSVGSCDAYEMKLLDVDTSWNLLSTVIFGKETVPQSKLVELGKEIAKCCKGLPLAIVVIGGLLKRSQKTPEVWKNIARNVTSILRKEHDGRCLSILSFSYNHLPVHLKPCFLYMATFEADRVISISNLIKLWVADGFLRPINNITLEEAASQYVNDLIDRNLVTVMQRSSSGKVKGCTVHDVLREFCLEEVQKERFIEFKYPPKEGQRRLVLHELKRGTEHLSSGCLRHARSFISSNTGTIQEIVKDFHFLRVFSGEFSNIEKHLVHLRYIRCKIGVDSNFFSHMYLFLHLETLIVTCQGISIEEIILPSRIWELQYLRHVEFFGLWSVILPLPTHDRYARILKNMQTLSGITNFDCTAVEVLYRIPNLKTLNVSYNQDYVLKSLKLHHRFTNLACFHKLETLKCCFKGLYDPICAFIDPMRLSLPCNLREFTLSASNMPWKSMSIVGCLPNLEVLKLKDNAFCGHEWKTSEGEFERLKYLSIDECSLRIWRVHSSGFPRLEHLKLVSVDLEEIPFGIGELPSLELMIWHTTKLSTVILAKKIQEHLGNDGLSIKVVCSSYFGKALEEVKKLASATFQVDCDHWLLYLDDEKLVQEILGTEKFNIFQKRWKERDCGDNWESYLEEIKNIVSNGVKERIAVELQ